MEMPDQEKMTRVEASYTIVQGSDPADLSKKVAQAMAEGWGLCGGPFVVNVQTPALKDIMAATMQTVWMQAVYRIIQIPLSPEEAERLRRENSPIIT
jgi:hypothetical protein